LKPSTHSYEGLSEGPFLCIVNPKSGTAQSRATLDDILRIAPQRHVTTIVSQSSAHMKDLAANAESEGYVAVIAAGGDGSVHGIAAELIGSEVALGIIPMGSGNGIARHLGLSADPMNAFIQLMQGRSRRIDTFTVNGVPAIGFAGVGIDGQVASAFEHAPGRGFKNYLRLTFKAFAHYEPSTFHWRVDDGDTTTDHAWTVICANTEQFGNNAIVNATGVDCDGLLECIVVRDIPRFMLAGLSTRLFTRSLHKSAAVKVVSGKKIILSNRDRAALQIDGEVAGHPEEVVFEVVPKSLRILVP
jgi:diacylglycerol kinase (ATP)